MRQFPQAATTVPSPDSGMRPPCTSSPRAMAANGGLLTLAQARDHGLTTTHCANSCGTVCSSPCDVACTSTASWRSLDPYREQHRLRTRAVTPAEARLRRQPRLRAHEHGLEILPPPDPHTHITRPGSTTAWTDTASSTTTRASASTRCCDRRARGPRSRAYGGGHRSRARRAVRRDRVRRGHASGRHPSGARGCRAHDPLATSRRRTGRGLRGPGRQPAETLARILVASSRSVRPSRSSRCAWTAGGSLG